MAGRRKRSSKRSSGNPLLAIVGVMFLVALALAGGYAWRSYAPLPLPGHTPLSGDVPPAGADSVLRAEVRAALQRAESAEKEAEKLRKEVTRLASQQQQTEAELADMQIKDVLGDVSF